MLTDRAKQLICVRLGPIVKYTINGGFYWREQEQRFVPLETFDPYTYFLWHSSYYLIHSFISIFFIYLYQTAFPAAIPEEQDDLDKIKDNESLLVCLNGTIFMMLFSTTIMMGSVAIDYRHDFAYSLTQIFKWEGNLNKKLGINWKPPTTLIPLMKQMESIVNICWYVPWIIPLSFAITSFHPLDALRKSVGWFFEIDFGPNVKTVMFLLFEMYAVNAYAGVALGPQITLLALVNFLRYWLLAALPKKTGKAFITNKKGTIYVATAHLGMMSEDDLIWLCRSIQVLKSVTDTAAGTRRVAYHFAVLQVVAVVSVFSLMRMLNVVLNGTLMGISMLGLLVGCPLVSVSVIMWECFQLHALEATWNAFAKNVLSEFGRKCKLAKVIRSIKPVTVHTAGHYFNVNKSAFLHWANNGVNYLVNLLVTF